MGLLTLETLSDAIQERLGVPRAAAETQAEQVLDIFGFDTEVIDNVLEPEERQMFYLLQAQGLLTTRSEETGLWNGQEWRTHYWLLREDRIRAAERPLDERRFDGEAAFDEVYALLPEGAWKH